MVLILITSLMILIGLLGIFLPFLPGVPIAWLGIFIYAYFTNFETLPLLTVLIFFLLTLLTIVLDFVAPLIGAKKYQASSQGILGASLGLILGIFVFGPLGIILGPLAGAFFGEILAGKESSQALRSASGTLIGLLVGSLIKILVIMIMAGFFIHSLI
jgi:uncharacterized protein YqgC (DUF456 family)